MEMIDNRIVRKIAILLTFLFVQCVSSSKYDEVVEEKNRIAVDRNRVTEARDKLIDELMKERHLYAEFRVQKDARIDQLETALEAAGQQIDQTEAQRMASLKEKRAMEEELRVLRERQEMIERQMATYKSLIARFRDMIDRGDLKVRFEDGRMYLVLASDVLFPSGVATLSKSGKETILETGRKLVGIDRKFQVEGHTDDRPIKGGSLRFRNNWELGAGRAISVVETLIDAGVPANRVSAASFSDTLPVKPNNTREGRAANRRIEIVIIPDLMPIPELETD